MTRHWMYFSASVPTRAPNITAVTTRSASLSRHYTDPGECDCGGVKGRRAEACDECVALDGTRASAKITSFLRVRPCESTESIARGAGVSRENTQRTLTRMLDVGRVRRWVEEESLSITPIDPDNVRTKRTTIARWHYRLR